MVAQLVEQLPLKQLVLGSSPSHSTKEKSSTLSGAFFFYLILRVLYQ